MLYQIYYNNYNPNTVGHWDCRKSHKSLFFTMLPLPIIFHSYFIYLFSQKSFIITVNIKLIRSIVANTKENFLKCRDGWMEAMHWVTKYTNKESTFHNIVHFTQPFLHCK